MSFIHQIDRIAHLHSISRWLRPSDSCSSCSCCRLAHLLVLVRTVAARTYLLVRILCVTRDRNGAQVLDERVHETVLDERAEALAVRLVLVLQRINDAPTTHKI
ncbi:hypothetical protein PRIPAC_72528, partial [Pristionchus pacificus]|uniref:Uncharacterized protein n=1 Tax=Pristionchus pacificus TaxID=54126 RepID=A0A2A6BZR0_PRIPA